MKQLSRHQIKVLLDGYGITELQETLWTTPLSEALSTFIPVYQITEEEEIMMDQLDDDRLDLQRQLICRTLELAEKLNPWQKTVLSLLLQGRTMQDIAIKTGVCYTSINHAINGIRRDSGKFHGGLFPKLKQIVSADKVSSEILKELSRLNHEE